MGAERASRVLIGENCIICRVSLVVATEQPLDSDCIDSNLKQNTKVVIIDFIANLVGEETKRTGNELDEKVGNAVSVSENEVTEDETLNG